MTRSSLVAVAILMVATPAIAAPPCKGCTLDVPRTTDPVPLIVVLHGDRERAAAAAAPWRATTTKRGWALLSLQCPTALGCKDSWWQWNGDPSWVRDQVAAVAKTRAIDPARIYLVGWSGGASYMGIRITEWTDTFAAIVIHGGGVAPDASDCPARDLPAYFLVGDRNPLHWRAKDLRAYFDACKQDVTWDLIAGAAHDKEAAALTSKKANAILDWLDAHHR